MGNNMLVLKATRLELIKIFSKWRTYIGFATVAVLIPLIMWLVRKFRFRTRISGITLAGRIV
jgi:hypothetical protein